MVNHCANPTCNKQLHYLRDGKVFLFSGKRGSGKPSKLPQRLEHFWLCGACAKRWTLSMDGDNQVTLVETHKRRFHAGYTVAAPAPAS